MNEPGRIPLFEHGNAAQAIAWRNNQAITAARFLGEVTQLAGQLPPHPFVFNLCSDRYHFLLTFCAALLRGQTSLLPPNHAADTLTRLHARYPQSYGISDKALMLEGMDILPFPTLPSLDLGAFVIPAIVAGHVAAIVFTSGSTGEPQPYPKTWGGLVRQARLQAVRPLLRSWGLPGEAETQQAREEARAELQELARKAEAARADVPRIEAMMAEMAAGR
ncbi:MAG: hypothetical protein ACK4ZS_06165 [Sulfurimicrobium sp.]